MAAETAKIGTAEVYQERNGKQCNFFNSCIEEDQDINIKLTDISYSDGTPFPDGEKIKVYMDASGYELNCPNYPPKKILTWPLPVPLISYIELEVKNGTVETIIPKSGIRANCSYKLTVTLPKNAGDTEGTEKSIKVYPASSVAVLECEATDDQCKTGTSVVANYDLCKQQIKTGTDQFAACQECFVGNGIWTAVGCIPSNPESVIATVITIGLATGGGIVLIMILIGSFMLSVSQGDPNKTKEAKEIISSAIIGLLFIIFSVTILQFIGVSILHIPGFGE